LFAIGIDESAIKESLQQICNIDKVTFALLKDRVWEDEWKKDFHAITKSLISTQLNSSNCQNSCTRTIVNNALSYRWVFI
jgi:uncharacterized membrane protein